MPITIKQRSRKLLDGYARSFALSTTLNRTEETYVQWIRRYVLFHNKLHPGEMCCKEVNVFLTHLADEEHVAASMQNRALHAILFLYRKVLQRKIVQNLNALSAKRSSYLPTLLTTEEVRDLIRYLSRAYQLAVKLLYGCC